MHFYNSQTKQHETATAEDLLRMVGITQPTTMNKQTEKQTEIDAFREKFLGTKKRYHRCSPEFLEECEQCGVPTHGPDSPLSLIIYWNAFYIQELGYDWKGEPRGYQLDLPDETEISDDLEFLVDKLFRTVCGDFLGVDAENPPPTEEFDFRRVAEEQSRDAMISSLVSLIDGQNPQTDDLAAILQPVVDFLKDERTIAEGALKDIDAAYSSFGDVLEGMDPDDELGHWAAARAAQSAAHDRLHGLCQGGQVRTYHHQSGGLWRGVNHGVQILTRLDGMAYVRSLFEAGQEFHFEDDPAEVINIHSGNRLFPDEIAAFVRRRVTEMYSIDWGAHECPNGFALTLTEAKEAHTDEN
tara:strand:+ start:833 stop:1897 length:1065 start_codon:yes stop_codon:yes gene_type:complete